MVVNEGGCRWEEEGGRWGEELGAKVAEKGEHALEVQTVDFELIVVKWLEKGKRLETDEALQFAYITTINEFESCGVKSPILPIIISTLISFGYFSVSSTIGRYDFLRIIRA